MWAFENEFGIVVSYRCEMKLKSESCDERMFVSCARGLEARLPGFREWSCPTSVQQLWLDMRVQHLRG
jgi:hypothetical protein